MPRRALIRFGAKLLYGYLPYRASLFFYMLPAMQEQRSNAVNSLSAFLPLVSCVLLLNGQACCVCMLYVRYRIRQRINREVSLSIICQPILPLASCFLLLAYYIPRIHRCPFPVYKGTDDVGRALFVVSYADLVGGGLGHLLDGCAVYLVDSIALGTAYPLP